MFPKPRQVTPSTSLLISISSIPKTISSYPDFEKVILLTPSISIEKKPLSSDDVSDFSVLIRTKLMGSPDSLSRISPFNF